ncbi:MAG: iron(III) transport system ATP-binding protein, partial [Solirubrobacteraceae bacterium]|nr:iron(III) transport system ATP-binding protein [Solirubrobacteraceae bacterium]
GPSGCGKSTTLRCIAGLERVSGGEIVQNDRVISSKHEFVPPHQRDMGMVFQSYAIWPHMSVFENAAFPLEVGDRKYSRKEIRDKVMRVLEATQLGHLADREATKLSGGQQQRLALARALVMEPPVLLLDEPLSNLDAKLREDMRFELKRLQRELGVTCVYVTHDQVEALAMSSSVAVMRDGRIEQVGTPREVYEGPTSRFVADFIGTSNFIDGVVDAHEGGVYLVRTAEGVLRVRSEADFAVGAAVAVAARPEHVAIEVDVSPNGGRPNRWHGRVAARAFLGESVDHMVTVGSSEIRVRCNPSVSIPPHTQVVVTFREETCSLTPAE